VLHAAQASGFRGRKLNLVDVGIILFAVALAAVGYQRGLLASALPLAGFVGGAALGARVGPRLLDEGATSPYAPLVAVLTGVVAGAFLAVALGGVGRAVRRRILGSAIGVVDGIGGALLLAALALLIAWSVGAVALHTGEADMRRLREAVQQSAILGALNDVLPPSGPLLRVLRRVDPTPAVRGPEAAVDPPDEGVLGVAAVRAAGDSTVRVLGTACGLGVAGSGWVAAPGVVVTNAHVVAGEEDTSVTTSAGAELDATAVHYEPRNDLAVLAVPDLSAPALELAPRAGRGDDAAVVGYPENGPLSFSAARLGRTGTVISQDSYGRGPVRRRITPFRADVRSGNSGGPVVDARGRVVATVFGATTDPGREDGLGIPNDVVARALGGELTPVDTGACAA
jgi:S1-C subfamily serine protease